MGQDETRGQPGERRPAKLAPGLYVTATPIGNASDVTLRALHVLRSCDAILAEDTRVTSRLLALHGISRPLLSYNDHNAPAMRPKILARLREGARLALVSDAGTPLISDPGHKLVRDARAEGLPVYPVPGPCAAVAALSAAGLPTDRFLFAGFLPAKPGERDRVLAELASLPATLIFYESPNRLVATLAALAAALGDREAVVGRELTKLYEELRGGTLSALAAHYQAHPPKGEITILVAAPQQQGGRDLSRVDALLRLAMPHMPLAAAVALVTQATEAPRKSVYARALALRDRNGAAP